MKGLSLFKRYLKRSLDIAGALIGLLLTGWLILLAYVLASIDTRQNGFFLQARIGKDSKPFRIVKIRTMRDDPTMKTTVTRANDHRITRLGRFFRRTKIDELPQFLNVLWGDMSLVGPRPDVRGYANRLAGPDRVILSVRPGLVGPGTLKYVREEEELEKNVDPDRYNREVIFPEKVRLNRQYVENYSLWNDLKYLYRAFKMMLFP